MSHEFDFLDDLLSEITLKPNEVQFGFNESDTHVDPLAETSVRSELEGKLRNDNARLRLRLKRYSKALNEQGARLTQLLTEKLSLREKEESFQECQKNLEEASVYVQATEQLNKQLHELAKTQDSDKKCLNEKIKGLECKVRDLKKALKDNNRKKSAEKRRRLKQLQILVELSEILVRTGLLPRKYKKIHADWKFEADLNKSDAKDDKDAGEVEEGEKETSPSLRVEVQLPLQTQKVSPQTDKCRRDGEEVMSSSESSEEETHKDPGSVGKSSCDSSVVDDVKDLYKQLINSTSYMLRDVSDSGSALTSPPSSYSSGDQLGMVDGSSCQGTEQSSRSELVSPSLSVGSVRTDVNKLNVGGKSMAVLTGEDNWDWAADSYSEGSQAADLFELNVEAGENRHGRLGGKLPGEKKDASERQRPRGANNHLDVRAILKEMCTKPVELLQPFEDITAPPTPDCLTSGQKETESTTEQLVISGTKPHWIDRSDNQQMGTAPVKERIQSSSCSPLNSLMAEIHIQEGFQHTEDPSVLCKNGDLESTANVTKRRSLADEVQPWRYSECKAKDDNGFVKDLNVSSPFNHVDNSLKSQENQSKNKTSNAIQPSGGQEQTGLESEVASCLENSSGDNLVDSENLEPAVALIPPINEDRPEKTSQKGIRNKGVMEDKSHNLKNGENPNIGDNHSVSDKLNLKKPFGVVDSENKRSEKPKRGRPNKKISLESKELCTGKEGEKEEECLNPKSLENKTSNPVLVQCNINRRVSPRLNKFLPKTGVVGPVVATRNAHVSSVVDNKHIVEKNTVKGTESLKTTPRKKKTASNHNSEEIDGLLEDSVLSLELEISGENHDLPVNDFNSSVLHQNHKQNQNMGCGLRRSKRLRNSPEKNRPEIDSSSSTKDNVQSSVGKVSPSPESLCAKALESGTSEEDVSVISKDFEPIGGQAITSNAEDVIKSKMPHVEDSPASVSMSESVSVEDCGFSSSESFSDTSNTDGTLVDVEGKNGTSLNSEKDEESENSGIRNHTIPVNYVDYRQRSHNSETVSPSHSSLSLSSDDSSVEYSDAISNIDKCYSTDLISPVLSEHNKKNSEEICMLENLSLIPSTNQGSNLRQLTRSTVKSTGLVDSSSVKAATVTDERNESEALQNSPNSFCLVGTDGSVQMGSSNSLSQRNSLRDHICTQETVRDVLFSERKGKSKDAESYVGNVDQVAGEGAVVSATLEGGSSLKILITKERNVESSSEGCSSYDDIVQQVLANSDERSNKECINSINVVQETFSRKQQKGLGKENLKLSQLQTPVKPSNMSSEKNKNPLEVKRDYKSTSILDSIKKRLPLSRSIVPFFFGKLNLFHFPGVKFRICGHFAPESYPEPYMVHKYPVLSFGRGDFQEMYELLKAKNSTSDAMPLVHGEVKFQKRGHFAPAHFSDLYLIPKRVCINMGHRRRRMGSSSVSHNLPLNHDVLPMDTYPAETISDGILCPTSASFQSFPFETETMTEDSSNTVSSDQENSSDLSRAMCNHCSDSYEQADLSVPQNLVTLAQNVSCRSMGMMSEILPFVSEQSQDGLTSKRSSVLEVQNSVCSESDNCNENNHPDTVKEVSDYPSGNLQNHEYSGKLQESQTEHLSLSHKGNEIIKGDEFTLMPAGITGKATTPPDMNKVAKDTKYNAENLFNIGILATAEEMASEKKHEHGRNEGVTILQGVVSGDLTGSTETLSHDSFDSFDNRSNTPPEGYSSGDYSSERGESPVEGVINFSVYETSSDVDGNAVGEPSKSIITANKISSTVRETCSETEIKLDSITDKMDHDVKKASSDISLLDENYLDLPLPSDISTSGSKETGMNWEGLEISESPNDSEISVGNGREKLEEKEGTEQEYCHTAVGLSSDNHMEMKNSITRNLVNKRNAIDSDSSDSESSVDNYEPAVNVCHGDSTSNADVKKKGTHGNVLEAVNTFDHVELSYIEQALDIAPNLRKPHSLEGNSMHTFHSESNTKTRKASGKEADNLLEEEFKSKDSQKLLQEVSAWHNMSGISLPLVRSGTVTSDEIPEPSRSNLLANSKDEANDIAGGSTDSVTELAVLELANDDKKASNTSAMKPIMNTCEDTVECEHQPLLQVSNKKGGEDALMEKGVKTSQALAGEDNFIVSTENVLSTNLVSSKLTVPSLSKSSGEVGENENSVVAIIVKDGFDGGISDASIDFEPAMDPTPVLKKQKKRRKKIVYSSESEDEGRTEEMNVNSANSAPQSLKKPEIHGKKVTLDELKTCVDSTTSNHDLIVFADMVTSKIQASSLENKNIPTDMKHGRHQAGSENIVGSLKSESGVVDVKSNHLDEDSDTSRKLKNLEMTKINSCESFLIDKSSKQLVNKNQGINVKFTETIEQIGGTVPVTGFISNLSHKHKMPAFISKTNAHCRASRRKKNSESKVSPSSALKDTKEMNVSMAAEPASDECKLPSDLASSSKNLEGHKRHPLTSAGNTESVEESKVDGREIATQDLAEESNLHMASDVNKDSTVTSNCSITWKHSETHNEVNSDKEVEVLAINRHLFGRDFSDASLDFEPVVDPTPIPKRKRKKRIVYSSESEDEDHKRRKMETSANTMKSKIHCKKTSVKSSYDAIFGSPTLSDGSFDSPSSLNGEADLLFVEIGDMQVNGICDSNQVTSENLIRKIEPAVGSEDLLSGFSNASPSGNEKMKATNEADVKGSKGVILERNGNLSVPIAGLGNNKESHLLSPSPSASSEKWSDRLMHSPRVYGRKTHLSQKKSPSIHVTEVQKELLTLPEKSHGLSPIQNEDNLKCGAVPSPKEQESKLEIFEHTNQENSIHKLSVKSPRADGSNFGDVIKLQTSPHNQREMARKSRKQPFIGSVREDVECSIGEESSRIPREVKKSIRNCRTHSQTNYVKVPEVTESVTENSADKSPVPSSLHSSSTCSQEIPIEVKSSHHGDKPSNLTSRKCLPYNPIVYLTKCDVSTANNSSSSSAVSLKEVNHGEKVLSLRKHSVHPSQVSPTVGRPDVDTQNNNLPSPKVGLKEKDSEEGSLPSWKRIACNPKLSASHPKAHGIHDFQSSVTLDKDKEGDEKEANVHQGQEYEPPLKKRIAHIPKGFPTATKAGINSLEDNGLSSTNLNDVTEINKEARSTVQKGEYYNPPSKKRIAHIPKLPPTVESDTNNDLCESSSPRDTSEGCKRITRSSASADRKKSNASCPKVKVSKLTKLRNQISRVKGIYCKSKSDIASSPKESIVHTGGPCCSKDAMSQGRNNAKRRQCPREASFRKEDVKSKSLRKGKKMDKSGPSSKKRHSSAEDSRELAHVDSSREDDLESSPRSSPNIHQDAIDGDGPHKNVTATSSVVTPEKYEKKLSSGAQTIGTNQERLLEEMEVPPLSPLSDDLLVDSLIIFPDSSDSPAEDMEADESPPGNKTRESSPDNSCVSIKNIKCEVKEENNKDDYACKGVEVKNESNAGGREEMEEDCNKGSVQRVDANLSLGMVDDMSFRDTRPMFVEESFVRESKGLSNGDAWKFIISSDSKDSVKVKIGEKIARDDFPQSMFPTDVDTQWTSENENEITPLQLRLKLESLSGKWKKTKDYFDKIFKQVQDENASMTEEMTKVPKRLTGEKKRKLKSHLNKLKGKYFGRTVLDTILEYVCNEKLCFESKHIAKYMVHILSKEDEDDVQAAEIEGAPRMTPVQLRMLSLIMVLENRYPQFHDLTSIMLSGMSYMLFRLGHCPPVEVVKTLARMYTVLCIVKKDIHKVRCFCYDALFAIGSKAVELITVVLSVWHEVLPKQEPHRGPGYLESCIFMVIAHLPEPRHVPKEVLRNITSLKLIAHKMYKSSYHKIPMNEYLNDLMLNLKEGTNLEGIEAAVVLMAKRQGWDWTHKNLLCGRLASVMEDWKKDGPSRKSAVTAISLIGLASRSCPIEICGPVKTIVEYISRALVREPCDDPIIKEALVTCLIRLSRYHFYHTVRALDYWKPMRPPPKEVEDAIRGLIKRGQPKFWKEKYRLWKRPVTNFCGKRIYFERSEPLEEDEAAARKGGEDEEVDEDFFEWIAEEKEKNKEEAGEKKRWTPVRNRLRFKKWIKEKKNEEWLKEEEAKWEGMAWKKPRSRKNQMPKPGNPQT